jgi:ubiquinone/menaquinone biosynthesis C-methylase UbiE
VTKIKEVDDYYEKYYSKVHRTGLLGGLNSMFHREMEKPYLGIEHCKILEVGSGNFEHFDFIKNQVDEIYHVDIREPSSKVPERPPTKTYFVKSDASSLPFKGEEFDRVLSTCLILHLENPMAAADEWLRVCKPGGTIDFLVPCDPGLLVRFIRQVISKKAAKKAGASVELYDLVNAYEHISSFPRIKRLMIHTASAQGAQLSIKYFPFTFLKSWNLNAFAIFTMRKSKTS